MALGATRIGGFMSSSFFKFFISIFVLIFIFIFLFFVPIYSLQGINLENSTDFPNNPIFQVLNGKFEWPAPRLYENYIWIWL